MQTLQFAGLTLYPYGLALCAGTILALLLARCTFRRAGIRPDALSCWPFPLHCWGLAPPTVWPRWTG